MDAHTPTEDTQPGPSGPAAVVLAAAGDELGTFLLACIAAGDTVVLQSDGSWYIGPDPEG